jgi:hypothetical protein
MDLQRASGAPFSRQVRLFVNVACLALQRQ